MSLTSYPKYTYIAEGDGNVNLYGTALDAFGRIRMSEPFTLFDSQNRYAKDSQFDESLTGSATATHAANEGVVNMAVTTASGDKAIRQTKRRFPYQPGKSLFVMATFVMAAAASNLRQRVGYFDTDNGVFLQLDDTELSFVLRSYVTGSVVDTRKVAKSSWNVDKFDGTGPSKLTLDITKAQIVFFDFEWLGVGSVRCGFVINGKLHLAHIFHNANSISTTYMTTAILPVRYEIEAKAALAASATMKQICSTVISEGGYQQKTALQWARMTSATTLSTSFEPLVSIKLNASKLGAVVLPASFAVLPRTSPADYEVALIKNATLTSASYTTGTFNNVDFDVAATALSGGTIVDVVYVSSSNQSGGSLGQAVDYNFDLQLGVTIGGTSDVYTLAARGLSGTPDMIGALAFWDLTD
jgi:hypothetical protein